MVNFSPAFLEVLRATLERLEHSPDLDSNDPKLLQFKASLMRAIAEMELRKSEAA